MHPLGEFLRSRRARLTPADVGLPSSGQRRVAGLRREEVAALVGVSVDYYVRLEQARVRPSDSVLNAVVRALRLTVTEREHLFRLVRGPGHDPLVGPVRPEVRRLLDHLVGVPAFVVNPRLDVLAWNRLAAALITDFGCLPVEHRNTAWLLFVDPATRRLYRNWEQLARDTAGMLRVASTSGDAGTRRLIDNLSRTSSEFRATWADHDVRVKTSGVKEFRHPVVGELDLQYEALALTDPHQSLLLYSPTDDAAAAALNLLAAWAGPAEDVLGINGGHPDATKGRSGFGARR